MKKIILITLLTTLFSLIMCKEHHHDEHGKAKIKIITDKNDLSLDFKGHAEPFIGFEHQAKSAADKEKQKKAFQQFENKASELFQIDGNCNYEKKSLSISQEGHHGIFHAMFHIQCNSLLNNKTLKFQVGQFFPEVTLLEVEILKETNTETITVNANDGRIKL